LICGDDAEAMEKAKQLAVDHDVELWQRDRKIATFNHTPK
jgi:HJR/Mrr/RecB family endonuclease